MKKRKPVTVRFDLDGTPMRWVEGGFNVRCRPRKTRGHWRRLIACQHTRTISGSDGVMCLNCGRLL